MSQSIRVLRLLALPLLFWVSASIAQEPETTVNEGMTNQRLGQLLERLDENTEGQPGSWRFTIDGVQVLLVTDARADRMRIFTPIGEFTQEDLPPELFFRMLQANFDSALDARYAIAKGTLWSVYIHPLSPLTDRQFLSGIAQTINLVRTFGTTFNSGALTFGGGDSQEKNQKLFEELLKRGEVL